MGTGIQARGGTRAEADVQVEAEIGVRARSRMERSLGAGAGTRVGAEVVGDGASVGAGAKAEAVEAGVGVGKGVDWSVPLAPRAAGECKSREQTFLPPDVFVGKTNTRAIPGPCLRTFLCLRVRMYQLNQN